MPFKGYKDFADCIADMTPKVGSDMAKRMCGKWQADEEG